MDSLSIEENPRHNILDRRNISIDENLELCKKYFKNVKLEKQKYPNSTQGKELVIGVFEFLMICKN